MSNNSNYKVKSKPKRTLPKPPRQRRRLPSLPIPYQKQAAPLPPPPPPRKVVDREHIVSSVDGEMRILRTFFTDGSHDEYTTLDGYSATLHHPKSGNPFYLEWGPTIIEEDGIARHKYERNYQGIGLNAETLDADLSGGRRRSRSSSKKRRNRRRTKVRKNRTRRTRRTRHTRRTRRTRRKRRSRRN